MLCVAPPPSHHLYEYPHPVRRSKAVSPYPKRPAGIMLSAHDKHPSIGAYQDDGRIEISIRQSPERAKLAIAKPGQLEIRDRKPVDPVPILSMTVKGDTSYLQSPYWFMSVTLWDPEQDKPAPYPQHESLAGTTVSSLHRLKDVDDTDGAFFVFGDLSIKHEGFWRLRFDLFEIQQDGVYKRKTKISDSFKTYTAKEFPGMKESTHLSRSFGEQGVRLRLRKEQRSAGRKRTATMANLSGQGQGVSMGMSMPIGYPLHYPPQYMPGELNRQSPYTAHLPQYGSAPPTSVGGYETYVHGDAVKRQRLSVDLGHQQNPLSPPSARPDQFNSTAAQAFPTPQSSQPHSHHSSINDIHPVQPSPGRSERGFTFSATNPAASLGQGYGSLTGTVQNAPIHTPTLPSLGSLHNSLVPGAGSGQPLIGHPTTPQSMPPQLSHIQPIHSPQPGYSGLLSIASRPGQVGTGSIGTMPFSPTSLISPRKEAPPVLTTASITHPFQPSPVRPGLPDVLLASPTTSVPENPAVVLRQPLGIGSGLHLPPLHQTTEGQASLTDSMGLASSGKAAPAPQIQRPEDSLRLGPPSDFEDASRRSGGGGGGGSVS